MCYLSKPMEFSFSRVCTSPLPLIPNYSNNVSTYLFIAFNISMVTRTDKAMVIGCGSLKILQSIPRNSSPPPMQAKWWVNCQYDICGPFSENKNHHEAAPTVAAPT